MACNINRQRSACLPTNKYLSFSTPSPPPPNNYNNSSATVTTTTSEESTVSATLLSGNNGVYVGAMVKPFKQIRGTHKSILHCLGLPISSLRLLTLIQQRVGTVLLGILVGSALVYDVGDHLTWLCHRLSSTLILPIFAIACGYYWLAIGYRSTWSTTSIYLLFCACYVGEVIAQLVFCINPTTTAAVEEREEDSSTVEACAAAADGNDGLPTIISNRRGAAAFGGLYLVLSQSPLLLTISAAGYFSSLSTVRQNVVVGGLVFVSRVIAVTHLTAFPRSIRPFVAYTCGLFGIVMAKYMEALFHGSFEPASAAAAGGTNNNNVNVVSGGGSPNAGHLLLLPSPEGGNNSGGTGRMSSNVRRRRASSSANLHVHGPKGRRTSLPAISLQKNHVQPSNQSGMSSIDLALLSEAHGLITDMLADSSLPLHVVSGLRALSHLLSPPPNHVQSHTQRLRFAGITAAEFGSAASADNEEIPIMGEKLSALPKKFRKTFQASLLRRMSTSTWTTTTSATGMPTLEPEPCRKRSTSFRNAPDLITSSSPTSQLLAVQDHYCLHERSPVSKYRSYSTTSLIQNPTPHRRLIRERKTVCSLHPLTASDINRLHCLSDAAIAAGAGIDGGSGGGASSGGEDNDDDRRSFGGGDLSDGGCDAAGGSYDSIGVGGVTLSGVSSGETSPCLSPGILTAGSGSGSAAVVVSVGTVAAIPTIRRADLGSGRIIYVEDGTKYDLERLAEDHVLDRIMEWDYPIFELEQLNKACVLSKMCYRVFLEAGLFETFRIPIQEFLAYFHALESGYRDKPYHNRMHAADVLHAVFYLTTQPIPGFTHLPLEDSPPPVQKSETGSSSPGLVQRQSFNAEDTYGIMGANLPALELMALYTAAAMHDYDHPGRTNAFLVTTYAPQAILYNDRSVLENHHAAAAWNLFLSKSDYNFLCHLDKAEFKRFRFLVIEAILATDLKRHFEILAEFNAKANDDDAPGIDWNLESDRLLAMEMCIKLADINGPCKRHDIHVQWTKRIADEFYEQGDEEANLGLTISPFMDRHNPQLSKLQESFINHLVAPLCTSYGEAGLLPGTWVQGSDSEDEGGNQDVDEANGDETTARRDKMLKVSRKITSFQTEHLKENHDHWTNKVREEEESLKLNSRQEGSEG